MARPREFDEKDALQRAMELFWAKGYEATSIADLVEHTGVARAGLYNVFGSKHDLYLAALDHYTNVESSRAGGLLHGSAPARERISRYLEDVISEADCSSPRRGCFVVNSAIERAHCDAATAERIAATSAGAEKTFAAILRAAISDGELADDLDPIAVARFLGNVAQGLKVSVRAGADIDSLRDVVETALTVLDAP